jgi:hypothetical protein
MARTMRGGCVLATVFAGCTVEQDGGAFGEASSATYTTYATTQPNADEGGASESTGATEDAGSEGTSGAATESTGDAGDDGESSDGGSESSGGGTTGGALPPGNGQPMDGMWSHCTTAQECGPIPALCIYMVDENANPVDGFCTETGCANPAVDCAANPGGTAPPVCVPMEINEVQDQVCALNCGAGTCPTGMVCMNFSDLGMVCM